MVDKMEIDLMPVGIKNQMRMIQKVGICAEVCVFVLLVFMWVAGFFRDVGTGAFFSMVLLLIASPLLIPGLMFEKVSQSTVRFATKEIQILNSRGKCWRSIEYSTISTVCVEEIAGFFYGHNKDLFRNKYVCVMLNGSKSIPNVSFAKLFSDKDFFMFSYNYEALQLICNKYQK